MKHCYEWGRTMAKQIVGVYERILECAKKEFLDKGYTDASLRTIAAEAETSTNSIYVRFKDKEGLFSAIVEPVKNEFLDIFTGVQETFHSFDKDTQRREMGRYTESEMNRMIDYMYDNLDAFHLLLDASYGTRFQDFVDQLVRIEVNYTYKYMDVMGCSPKTDNICLRDILHIVTTSYFEGLFEVIRHDMSREQAKKYIELLGKYHHTGFSTVFFQNWD